jgi:hypothetical protein
MDMIRNDGDQSSVNPEDVQSDQLSNTQDVLDDNLAHFDEYFHHLNTAFVNDPSSIAGDSMEIVEEEALAVPGTTCSDVQILPSPTVRQPSVRPTESAEAGASSNVRKNVITYSRLNRLRENSDSHPSTPLSALPVPSSTSRDLGPSKQDKGKEKEQQQQLDDDGEDELDEEMDELYDDVMDERASEVEDGKVSNMDDERASDMGDVQEKPSQDTIMTRPSARKRVRMALGSKPPSHSSSDGQALSQIAKPSCPPADLHPSTSTSPATTKRCKGYKRLQGGEWKDGLYHDSHDHKTGRIEVHNQHVSLSSLISRLSSLPHLPSSSMRSSIPPGHVYAVTNAN